MLKLPNPVQTCYSLCPMEWEEQVIDGNLTLILLRGEIDLQHSPKLRRLLQEKLAARVPAVLLDFSGVKYIDSSGLATLVEYYQSSRSYAGKIALAATSERVKSIFDLVRLNEIFEFYPTIEEARDGLTGTS